MHNRPNWWSLQTHKAQGKMNVYYFSIKNYTQERQHKNFLTRLCYLYSCQIIMTNKGMLLTLQTARPFLASVGENGG